jgi:hypothetical protein
MVKGKHPERSEHPEHEHFAMGEIDDFHQTPYQAKTDGDQGVNTTHQQTADHGLEDNF